MKPFSLSSMVTMMVFTALLLTSGQAVAWFGQSTPVREVEPCAGKLNALSGTTEAAFRIRGYGEGENFQQAKVEALREIAERIQVRVTGRSVSSTHMAGEDASASFLSTATLETTLRIDSAVQVCSHHSVKGDRWHAVFEFDSRSAVQRLIATLNETFHGQPVVLDGNPYLLESQLVNELRAGLTGKGAEDAMTVWVALKRLHGGWYLSAGEHQVRLAPQDILQAIHFTGSQTLLLSLIKKTGASASVDQLLEGDAFALRVDSTQSGYLSLFNLYADGRVSVLSANGLVTANKAEVVPQEELTFEAALAETGKATRDLYLAVLSDEPLPPSTLHQLRLGQGLVEGEDSYQLPILLGLLKQVNPRVASTMVTTLPKMGAVR